MRLIFDKNTLYKEIGIELMKNAEDKWVFTIDFWKYYIEIWIN